MPDSDNQAEKKELDLSAFKDLTGQLRIDGCVGAGPFGRCLAYLKINGSTIEHEITIDLTPDQISKINDALVAK